MDIPRVSVKNIRTLYMMRPAWHLAYREVIERVAKLPPQEVVRQIDTLLHAYTGDIPVEAVREVGLRLNGWGLRLPNVAPNDDVQTPAGVEAMKLAALYAAEIYFGAARSLDLLANRYDEQRAEEQDIEDLMRLDEEEDE